ncbi:uncharacterized protein BXZ73DRAFT_97025 [Epithele typhae]|uniref:uncharacterized protein n=1 Tax=Epithele typhae TaxID=378194 RepID=UPI002008135B|nr:uncharacterized protein BXZ73DRAFT_97025 [Epithele typhae]KAH9944540.1 hypothetical protein BXZ73DRAFT_97025 [Epithele typhae]
MRSPILAFSLLAAAGTAVVNAAPQAPRLGGKIATPRNTEVQQFAKFPRGESDLLSSATDLGDNHKAGLLGRDLTDLPTGGLPVPIRRGLPALPTDSLPIAQLITGGGKSSGGGGSNARQDDLKVPDPDAAAKGQAEAEQVVASAKPPSMPSFNDVSQQKTSSASKSTAGNQNPVRPLAYNQRRPEA